MKGREAHHALHVLRLRNGDRISILDGAGHELVSEIERSDRDKLSLRILERREIPRPASQITLLQALPKGKLMDSIIQKATELGTYRIVPLLTERVVHQFNKKEGLKKVEKWQLIAIESVKQCGSPWLPKIEEPITIEEFLARKEQFDLPLAASIQGAASNARKYFQEFQANQGRKPASVCVWIGPEGDFTPEEMSAIKTSGARPITLGPNVLRTETAAIYCLSILNYELQSASS